MVDVKVATRTYRGGSLIAHFVDKTGKAWSLQYTPETIDLGGLGNKYAEVERQGLKPLVRFDAKKVRTLSFSHPITHRVPNLTGVVRALMDLADSGQQVRMLNVTKDVETRGWWVIEDLTVKVLERDTGQQMKKVELSWTLKEAFDERPKIARIPPPPKPKPKPKPPPPVTPKGTRDYVVKRGDSLWRIADRMLNNPTRWTEIYDANKARLHLAPPVMYAGLLTVWIYSGQVLKIPAA